MAISLADKPITSITGQPRPFLIQDIAGLSAAMAQRLQKAGFSKVEDLAVAHTRDLAKRIDSRQDIAELIISTSQRILNQVKISKSTKDTQRILLASLEFTDIEDIGQYTLVRMVKAGISSVRDLALANVDDLAVQINVTKESTKSLILAAQRLLKESNIYGSADHSRESQKDVTVTKQGPKIRDIKGISPTTAVSLGLLGFSVEILAITSVEELTSRGKLSKDSAVFIISGAQKLLKRIRKGL